MPDPTPTAPKCPFELPVKAYRFGDLDRSEVCTASGDTIADDLPNDWADFIAHAINSHATLTDEVARLREVLGEIDNAISASFVSVPYEGKAEFAKERLGDARDIIAAALRGEA